MTRLECSTSLGLLVTAVQTIPSTTTLNLEKFTEHRVTPIPTSLMSFSKKKELLGKLGLLQLLLVNVAELVSSRQV